VVGQVCRESTTIAVVCLFTIMLSIPSHTRLPVCHLFSREQHGIVRLPAVADVDLHQWIPFPQSFDGYSRSCTVVSLAEQGREHLPIAREQAVDTSLTTTPCP